MYQLRIRQHRRNTYRMAKLKKNVSGFFPPRHQEKEHQALILPRTQKKREREKMAQQNKRNKKSEVQKYHDKSQFKQQGEKRITANECRIKRNHQKINDAQVFTSRRVC